MMSRLRPSVVAAKARLAEGYEQLHRRHLQGAPGVELCRAISDLRDEVLLGLFEATLDGFSSDDLKVLHEEMAVVAHGGYGRRDVAPWSDVDLMLLHTPRSQAQVGQLAERLFRDVFDAGLVLGHAVRTPDEACQLSCQDAQICSSLVESRLLTGGAGLFETFVRKFARQTRRRSGGLIAAIEQSRLEERLKYGETVYLLEPNVKRSQGGLRDLQLLRWVGMVRYGTQQPEQLFAQGVLAEDDYHALLRANEFLLWLRNEMHFHAGKAGDVLDRAEQLRIAQQLQYESVAGMLEVEQFMRDYFRHTNQVSHVVTRFLDSARPNRRLRALVSALFGHRVQGGFRVGPLEISATRQGLKRIEGSLDAILELVDLANLYGKRIEPATWEAVRREAARLPQIITPVARRHFLSLLSHPTCLGELLRGLHEVGLLERFIPGFAHARGLLQFNQYHKYTVDEHSFRAVDQVTEWLSDPGSLGKVYRGITRKQVLHLALLIHDLGKGYPEDHCEVGARIAEDTARRLGLDAHDREALKFLVHKHLMMNHLAFRRDTSDEQLVVRFAVEVGSPELMRMLYLLTAADLAAVGPGSWNNWKGEVIADLYHRTMQHLAGDSPGSSVEEYLESRREVVRMCLGPKREDPWFTRQVNSLPMTYLNGTEPEQIAGDLQLLRELKPRDVHAEGGFLPETETVRFTVATTEDVAPGIFHKLTGALTSHGLQILSAEINTLADGLVLDRFWVYDPDFTGEPPQDRLDQVARSLHESLTSPTAKIPSFRRTWQMGSKRVAVASAMVTRIHADNTTSDRFTILDIFTADRRGLLYTITRTLFELGLSVGRAKIGTFLDQVVDVFYVTDQQGRKIEGEAQLEAIRRRLLEVLAAIED